MFFSRKFAVAFAIMELLPVAHISVENFVTKFRFALFISIEILYKFCCL